MGAIKYFEEPLLSFGHGQATQDPRDGLTLFGPLDSGRPMGLRVGVIGVERGISYFRHWLQRVQLPQRDASEEIARPLFPGFEAAFGIRWHPTPALSISIPEDELIRAIHIDDSHQRVHAAVSLFTERLIECRRVEEVRPDLWFVVLPDAVRELCRPQSQVPKTEKVRAPTRLTRRLARTFRKEPSLFAADNTAAATYEYDVDFHNQLKARLLEHGILTQIVLESVVMPTEGIPEDDRPANDSRPFQAAIAWNLSTAAFYKAGGRPWKVEAVRDGVCYVGLVFKRDDRQPDPRFACCAAQLFLDSGDGVVFKGNLGPWYSDETKEFHLSRSAASSLISQALKAYSARSGDGSPPKELFIHGRTMFDDDEWIGFKEAAATSGTKLIGVQIRENTDMRLYRLGTRPVLRGTAYVRSQRSAYLWTKGFSPRLRTYPGREVPRPLQVDVVRGDASIDTVLADVMALTKLNYNTCLLSDGLPVTLRFANSIGEILTAGPVSENVPLPFASYI